MTSNYDAHLLPRDNVSGRAGSSGADGRLLLLLLLLGLAASLLLLLLLRLLLLLSSSTLLLVSLLLHDIGAGRAQILSIERGEGIGEVPSSAAAVQV